MRKTNKKRCISCLLLHPAALEICPYCGYSAVQGCSQPYHDALPLGWQIDSLQIGRAVQVEKNCITYLGLDAQRGLRLLIREFFAHGYVHRLPDGQVVAADPSYASLPDEYIHNFTKGCRHILGANATLYTFRRLWKKRLRCRHERFTPVHTAYRSIIGQREQQEDAAGFHLFADGLYAVLCDGMGGMPEGKTASIECVRIMLEIEDTVQHCDALILPEVLRRQAEKANRFISSLRDAEGELLHCGTTLLCAVVREDMLYFVCAGDSHMYLIRDNTITLLNTEHTYFTELLSRMADRCIDYADAAEHPKRDALTSFVGIGNLLKLHVSTIPILLQEDDRLLLCSDGLYRTLSDDEMLRIISQYAAVEPAVDALIRLVEDRAHPAQDNTTIILYKHAVNKRK